MAKLSFDAFSKQLKSGDIPSAIYLHGDEDVLKDEAVRTILEQVVDPGLRDFNYDQRSAAQLEPDAVETLCNTLPMMADRRLVVIRDIELWQKRARARTAVLHYLQNPAAETILVLVQGAPRHEEDRREADPDLVGLSCAVELDRYGPKLAEQWVQKRAQERDIRLAPEAAAHLVKAVDGDLSAARSELDKLAGLGGAELVTLEQVTASLGIRHGETPADWCDAVLADHSGQAASILPHLLAQSGVSGVNLLNQLGTQLIGLGLARAWHDRGLRAGNLERAIRDALLRVRPPVRLDYRSSAEQWSRLAVAWPKERVAAAIRAARRADQRLKGTSLADERGILFDLIMQLAPLAEVEA
ncbi:MAG TPA: DNA polymerase III subunit delta [Gemmatimonadales bacterium]|jgi:DNA polymerase-3 subunit delta|nr:DNA polymerase III subunit delta [Gemmatimonadales bacterium]